MPPLASSSQDFELAMPCQIHFSLFSRKYANDSCLFAQWFKAHPLQSSTGFTEGLSRHLVLNLILKPGEKKSVKVKFTPVHNRTVSSIIIIRYVLWFKCGLTSSTYIRVLSWFVSVLIFALIYLWNRVFILSKICTHTHATPHET